MLLSAKRWFSLRFGCFRQFEMRENYRRELTVLLSNIITEKARKINGFKEYGNQEGHSISNVLCDMESVRKEKKIMQEKLLYLQVKSELKAAKSGKKPWVRIGFKNGSKKAKKRELGENGENSGENKPPFSTCFSGTLKILLERTFTPFFCCWPKSAKRCKWWLQKNIAMRFCSNTPNT